MWKTSINRTILECKATGDKINVQGNPVLIEPYWNVKLVLVLLFGDYCRSINRTILECKGSTAHSDHVLLRRINRTILECKVLLRLMLSAEVLRINRTILECKGLRVRRR